MKILIVDDNVAIQEIIRDILVDEGHIVRIAGTVPEAVSKVSDFHPDVIVLDTKIGDDDGLRVITQIKELYPGLRPNVILLKGSTEIVPTDNPYIKAGIDRPFRSGDLLETLKDIRVETLEAEEIKKEKRSRHDREKKERRLKRRSRIQPGNNETLSLNGVAFGNSYVTFEETPSMIYEFIGMFDPETYDVMVITADRGKAVKERFSYDGMEIVPLVSIEKKGRIGIKELGTLMDHIVRFIRGHGRPVIVFDTFNDIIVANGINESLLLIQQLTAGRFGTCTFALSVGRENLTDKDRRILLHNLIEFSSEE